jgi:hypothetical protein
LGRIVAIDFGQKRTGIAVTDPLQIIANSLATVPSSEVISYLAAYAQRFGATGLTFYDDAVVEFFSPHAAGKSVMFLLALGHRAYQTV